ncbi:phage portal protein [Brucella intermedia]|uniref:Phage portal protein n=1 Tax=Brucella intermedia GD04153 TaxID=2975438 RepID=A0AA42KSB8_9HYPH|nr:phage portal protein [Brucella intermedia]MDH0123292.1 phage portal protein [Brucella intermedia GD04153]
MSQQSESRSKAPKSRRISTHARSVRSSIFSNIFKSAKHFFEAASNSKTIEQSVDVGPNGYNAEIEKVRRRSRWMYANDSFYRQACRQVANNVVHYGIKPVIKDKKLLKLWNRWQKEADVRGRMDLYGLQYVAGFVIPRDGEAIIRFRERRPGDMRSGINFQLQMLESDHLPLDYTQQAPNGNWIVSGVERDVIERPSGYWLYDFHPKDWQGTGQQSLVPKRVSAEDVLHIYMPERLSDSRGYPWGASALNITERIRTSDEAQIEKQLTQAGFAGVFKKPRLSSDEPKDELATQKDDDDQDFVPVERGTFAIVPDDYDVEFAPQTQSDANYGVFRREHLSGLAVAMGFAVEHISLNFEKLNDRTYRAVMLECQRYIESIQYHVFVNQFCKPVWRRFLSYAVLHGLWAVPEGQDLEDWFDVEWMVPARGHIHPLQEIMAFAEAVKNGFTSRKRVAASFGEDVEDIDLENSEDQTRAKMLKLLYPIYEKLMSDDEMRKIMMDALAEPVDLQAIH